jgi:asparagine synthase (glutamine-hydrolysing)
MVGPSGSVISFNGEIYNYPELRSAAEARGRTFMSHGDTETILAEYERLGTECVHELRGMFAFALWDAQREKLTLVRDRFGIKPLYYARVGDLLYFASEAKALLPFLPSISTDSTALAEYLSFQYLIGDRTLFAGVRQLMPGHLLEISGPDIVDRQYWDVHYDIDLEHTERYFKDKLRELMYDSVRIHLRSDVEIGAYLSGGIDSTLMATLAGRGTDSPVKGFHGRFVDVPGYDESPYAVEASKHAGLELFVRDITPQDFEAHLKSVVYHLDYPVAGPGSFPQFEVSRMASESVKVVLGGQGGDEIFGGYARYLVAYLEQCLRAAIDGTSGNGNFVVTLQSIIPNLGILREYQPLIQQFWSEGLFGDLDARYLRLIDRGAEMGDAVRWGNINLAKATENYFALFNSRRNVAKEAYFDSMTHFEFKTLLPALLQVEDRMSMAHGLESRVPLLDHPLVEFVATIPADVKFKDGQLKRLLKLAFRDELPPAIRERRDKMGFPVPLSEWLQGPLRGFADGIFESMRERDSEFIDGSAAFDNYQASPRFSRKAWALISLELWQQQFHDQQAAFRRMAP